ncbi:hypothetical protein ACFL0D_05485, partial [Thermoproteota archaeon]
MVINARDYIIDRSLRIKETINDLRSKEYSISGPLIYLQILSDLVDIFSTRIDKYKLDIKSYRRIELYYEMIHYYLDDIEHINTINVPLEYLPLLNKILKINNSSSIIVLRPDTDYT